MVARLLFYSFFDEKATFNIIHFLYVLAAGMRGMFFYMRNTAQQGDLPIRGFCNFLKMGR